MLIAGFLPELRQHVSAPVVVTLQGDDIFLNSLTEPWRSRALDLLRQRKSRRDQDMQELPEHEESAELGPEDVLAQFQDGTAVHRALAQLTPLRRELVGLAFFQGLSHQEIAEAKDLPVGTVKSHLRRSLLALREALDG